jgi:hypothetical protein
MGRLIMKISTRGVVQRPWTQSQHSKKKLTRDLYREPMNLKIVPVTQRYYLAFLTILK